MRRLVIVLVASVLLGSVACNGRPPTLQEVADLATRAGSAVWKVDAEGCGWKSIGSAFAIDDRHFVTNHHVIANDSSPTLRSKDGTELKGRVIGSLTYPDVAVLEVSEDVDHTLGWTEPGSLAKNDPLVVIGYPGPKHRFSAAAGQVVGFYGTSREAALTNTPIANGNSGGPGVTPEQGVAGIVTLMRLVDDPKDRVAIMFTADAVRDRVAAFIAKPKEVLSSCGLGPDFVPTVPKGYDISSPPPTVAPVPVQTSAPTFTPLGTVTKRTPIPSPGAAPIPTDTPSPPCPTGKPSATVDEVSASESAAGTGWWTVEANGTVRNGASYAVSLRDIKVTVQADPPIERSVFPERETLDPGDAIDWRFTGDVYSPSAAPTKQAVSVALEWYWSENNYDWCPTA